MEKKLGYKVSEAPQCLTCHSVDLTPDTPLKDKKLDDFATAEAGVNCTACHGLGRNWQSEHFDEPLQKGQPLPWPRRTLSTSSTTGCTTCGTRR